MTLFLWLCGALLVVIVAYVFVAERDEKREAALRRELQADADYQRELRAWQMSIELSPRPVRLEPEAARKVMHKLFPDNALYWPSPSPAEYATIEELVGETKP